MAGVTRYFSSFTAALEEIKNALIFAGLHFRTACDDGQALGIAVADYVRRHALRSVDDDDDDDARDDDDNGDGEKDDDRSHAPPVVNRGCQRPRRHLTIWRVTQSRVLVIRSARHFFLHERRETYPTPYDRRLLTADH
jgi:hypothetical protein